jgi:hypothetical protein
MANINDSEILILNKYKYDMRCVASSIKKVFLSIETKIKELEPKVEQYENFSELEALKTLMEKRGNIFIQIDIYNKVLNEITDLLQVYHPIDRDDVSISIYIYSLDTLAAVANNVIDSIHDTFLNEIVSIRFRTSERTLVRRIHKNFYRYNQKFCECNKILSNLLNHIYWHSLHFYERLYAY